MSKISGALTFGIQKVPGSPKDEKNMDFLLSRVINQIKGFPRRSYITLRTMEEITHDRMQIYVMLI